MTDTIEWLEAIGANAKLRRAPVEELARLLAQEKAPEALRDAVMVGNREPLVPELGELLMQTTNIPNGPGHEEQPDEDEDEDKDEDDDDSTSSASNADEPLH